MNMLVFDFQVLKDNISTLIKMSESTLVRNLYFM